MTPEQILIEQKFELLYNSKTHMQYTKDLGGDGFTLLHVFLKPDGSFSGELEEVLLESDGSQYTITTKEPVEEDESLQQFLNRI